MIYKTISPDIFELDFEAIPEGISGRIEEVYLEEFLVKFERNFKRELLQESLEKFWESIWIMLMWNLCRNYWNISRSFRKNLYIIKRWKREIPWKKNADGASRRIHGGILWKTPSRNCRTFWWNSEGVPLRLLERISREICAEFGKKSLEESSVKCLESIWINKIFERIAEILGGVFGRISE